MMSLQVPRPHGPTLAQRRSAACQTLVSGYNFQLPPAAQVLSKAQLREIKFMGVTERPCIPAILPDETYP